MKLTAQHPCKATLALLTAVLSLSNTLCLSAAQAAQTLPVFTFVVPSHQQSTPPAPVQQPVFTPTLQTVVTPPVNTPPAPPPAGGGNNLTVPNFVNVTNYPILVPVTIGIRIPPRRPKKPSKDKPSIVAVKENKQTTEPAPTKIISIPQPIAPLPGIYQFSMDCGSGLSNEDNQFDMIAGRGALYSMESTSSVNLALGHMMIIAGNIEVAFKAGRLKAKVAPGCAMAAEVMADGTTKMYSLPTLEKTHGDSLIETPEDLGGETIALQPGQQMILTDKSLNQEELIAADGIAESPVEAGLTLKSNGHIHLVHYNAKRMQDTEVLIGCRRVTIPPTERLNKVQEAVAKAAQEDTAAQATAVQHLQPVSFSQQAAVTVGNRPGKALIDDRSRFVYTDAGTIFGDNGQNSVNLIKGSLIARSNTPLEIKAFGTTVSVTKGAIALVKSEDHFIKVVNLTDMASNSIQIHLGTDTLALLPGHEIIFSDQAPSLSHVFDIHQIGHRTIISRQLSAKVWATTAEVALADELLHQPLMKSLRAEHAHGQAITNEVLKTAAVLQTISHQSQYVRGELDDETESSTVVAHGCGNCLH